MLSKSSYESKPNKTRSGSIPAPNSVFNEVLHVLEVIANSKTGIGEVMQDYARQNCKQIKEIISARNNLLAGMQSAEDIEILHSSSDVIKSVGRFLELIPNAMRRNNANTIGKKERISAAQITRLYNSFVNSLEIQVFFVTAPGNDSFQARANI